MNKPKLLYYTILNYQPAILELINDNFEVKVLPSPKADTNKMLSQIEVGLAPLGFMFGREKIDRMPKLKVIASNTTGEPHIDRPYAESKGIKVFSLKYEQDFLKTITPTAEHTWGLLLALIRHTPWAFNSVLDGKWSRWPFGGKAMLSRLNLGIAGLGRIGKIIADYGRAFRMPSISFYDPKVSQPDAVGLIKAESLKQLVGNADVISIHIPSEKETYKIFNKELFSKFKKGSFLINTSRGELVDELALLECLKSGQLAGAALDVFDGEYGVNCQEVWQKNPLLKYARSHKNLLITPHIGGSTHDAWELTERRTIGQIVDYLKNFNNVDKS